MTQAEQVTKEVAKSHQALRKTSKSVETNARKVKESAEDIQDSALAIEDTADLSTRLAADRTIFAAERTYAAWVRTGLAALASGVGARALLEKAGLPDAIVMLGSSMLILFSAFCFCAAVWRELVPRFNQPRPAARRIPRAILFVVNGSLTLVALAALVAVWVSRFRSGI